MECVRTRARTFVGVIGCKFVHPDRAAIRPQMPRVQPLDQGERYQGNPRGEEMLPQNLATARKTGHTAIHGVSSQDQRPHLFG